MAVIALLALAGGSWALWVDRMDRGAGGFVSTGPLHMRTDTFAIVGDLRGDGPSWLYGRTVFGDARVRVRSTGDNVLFVGIARTRDVDRYLDGAGYATIDHFGTSDATTHAGRAPGSPSEAPIWAVSTTGTGEVTVPWTPRSGDWRIVMMNAGATAGVDVRGDLGAKLPRLPWAAGALLITGLVLAGSAGWLALPFFRKRPAPQPAADMPVAERVPVEIGR